MSDKKKTWKISAYLLKFKKPKALAPEEAKNRVMAWIKSMAGFPKKLPKKEKHK